MNVGDKARLLTMPRYLRSTRMTRLPQPGATGVVVAQLPTGEYSVMFKGGGWPLRVRPKHVEVVP